jgi:hypothetical protein
MRRITKSDYINLIKKKRLVSRRITFSLNLTSIISVIGLLLIYIVVKGSLLFIPELARVYLLKISPLDFSGHELEKILSITGDTYLFSLLLCVYWIFFILALLVIPGIVNLSFTPVKRIIKKVIGKHPDETLLSVHELIENIQICAQNPGIFSSLKLQNIIANTDLYSFASPITKQWYTKKRYQWFGITSIDKETREILFVLSKLTEALNRDLNNAVDLSHYLPVLALFELFLFSIVHRINKGKLEITDFNLGYKNEFELLRTFSSSARPIIIKAFHSSQKSPKKSNRIFSAIVRIFSTIRRIFQSFVVRSALSISGIAVVVMLIGVFLFKLDTSQAFFTWFTVTFSSLSISIGAASFRQIGKAIIKQEGSVDDNDT